METCFCVRLLVLKLCVEQLGIDPLRFGDLALAWRGDCSGGGFDGRHEMGHSSFAVDSYHCLFLCSALGTCVL